MRLDPGRTDKMIVCRDFWMSRQATNSYRLCDKCPPHPMLVINSPALSTKSSSNQQSQNIVIFIKEKMFSSPVKYSIIKSIIFY